MQPTAGDVYERLDIQERNKPGFCKRNLKWVIACAVFTVVLIITLALVLVFVVGRNIAQQQLDDAALINVRMQILSVQESSATVRLQALLDNRGHDGASIDASTVTLSIYPSGQAFGQLNMPAINANGGTFTALNITQTLQVTDKNAFSTFGRSLLDGETVTVTMSAKVSASARGITFKDLDLTKVITLKGHNGFRDPPIRVLDMKVQGGAGDVITLGITAEITNVADVMFADAGVLNLSMSYQGVDVGYAVSVGRASFPYGPSIIHQIGYITRTPQNRQFIESVFGQYTSGQTVTLTLHGNEQTTDIALLNPVLKTLSASAQLPGLTHQEDKLFANVYMKLTPDFPPDKASCNFTVQNRYTDVYIFAKNPLDVDISLNSADFLVTWDGDADKASYSGPGFPDQCSQVGYAFLLGRGVNDAINMKIPAKTTVVVPQRVCVTDNDDDLQAFTFYLLFCKKLSPGVDSPQPAPLFAHVKGHAVATIGTYLNGYMDYEQTGIPAVLHVVSPSDNQALPEYRFE